MSNRFTGTAVVLCTALTVQFSLLQSAAAYGWSEETDIARKDAASAATVPQGVAPLTARLGLNGVNFDLGQKWVLDMGLQGGTARNESLTGTMTHIFSNTVDDRSSAGLFVRNQTAWVLQLNSFTQERVVTTTRVENGDLIGFRLDLSVTGRCFLGPGAADDGDNYCTYTPGLATVPGAVDPDTLVPTLFSIDSFFGQEIPKETHESLKALVDGEPVFQRGEDVEGGPLVGVSFDIPNSGFLADQGSASGTRHEDIRTRYVMSLARVQQNLYLNSAEASADRTTRAFVLLHPDDWNRRNALTQLAAVLFPRMERPLEAAAGNPRLNISNNLFYALGNARRPANGLTVFETGYATVDHPARSPRTAAETPTAYYTGFWVGFTPERDTSTTQSSSFLTTGPRLDLNDPVFAEGGGSAGLDLLANSSLTILDSINQSIVPIDFSGISDIFVQLGLGLTTQDAVRRVTSTETSRFSYVPHLSFNGNITTGQSVFRYYLGAIISDKTNAYIGSDYTFETETGWSAYARAEAYTRPDADLRNEFEARVSRTIKLSASQSLTFGVGGVAVFQKGSDMLNPDIGDVADRVDFVGRWVQGPLNFNVRHRISEGDAESTTFGLGYANGGRFALETQFTPKSSESAYIEALAGLSWRAAEDAGAPILKAQVARAKYNLGDDGQGSAIVTGENLFVLSLQAKF